MFAVALAMTVLVSCSGPGQEGDRRAIAREMPSTTAEMRLCIARRRRQQESR